MFKSLLGRNMEAYMDDMIVKIEFLGNHVFNLSEYFGVISSHIMRLNP